MRGPRMTALQWPVLVANAGGKTLVTSAGSNGNFPAVVDLDVVDLDVDAGQVTGVRY
jgi:hypothetical protein